MRISKKTGLFLVLFFFITGISCFFVYRVEKQKTIVELYVFDTCGGCNVQNPCKPCTVFAQLINEYTALLSQNNLKNKVELKPYNIYFDNDSAVYQKNIKALGFDVLPVLPAVITGKRIMAGKKVIDNGLVDAVKQERRFFSLAVQALGNRNSEKIKTGVYDEKTAVVFSLPTCEDCIKTSAYLKTIAGLRIITLEPSDSSGRALYERYCDVYGVSLDDYAVPRLFMQNSALLGYEEISKKTGIILENNFKTIRIDIGEPL